MIGIYLNINFGGQSTSRLSPPFLEGKQKIVNFEWGNGAVALITPKYVGDSNYFFCNEDEFIVVDGHVFHEDERIGAQELFDHLTSNPNFYEELNGEFLFVIKNTSGIKAVSDRLGQRQHYFSNKDGNLFLSPCLNYLKILGNIESKINENSLQTFLFFNKLRFLDETIWEGINVFPAGVVYNINEINDVTKYWKIHYDNNVIPNIDDLIKLYKKAVLIRYNSNTLGAISLSGGLDSRTIVAALPSYENISGITIGQSNSDEVEIARKVAASKSIAFKHYETSGDTFWEELDFNQFTDDDIDILLQGVWRPFLKQNIEFAYLIHGLDLDVTLGGIYLKEALSEISTEDEFRNYIKKQCLSTDIGLILNLFSKDEIKVEERLNYIIDTFIEKLEGNSFIEKFDNLIMRFSMGRVILKRYSDIRRYHDTITPMYDSEFLDYLYGVPIELRMNYKLFHPFFAKLDQELFDLPYQRTGLPGSTPVSFWNESQQLQSNQEELFRKIAFETKGKQHLKYDKYYTNADEWLRFNDKWITICNWLLLRSDSLITAKYLNRNILAEIINDHQTHKRSHMKILMILMSAEIYLLVASGKSSDDIRKCFFSL